MNKTIIITEGSVQIGLGHVQRMLALAETIGHKNDVTFVTKSDKAVVDRIRRAGYTAISVTNTYETVLSEVEPFDCIVIDRLQVEVRFTAWIRANSAAKVIVFGNTSDANRHAHMVVNAIIGTNRFESRKYIDGVSGTLYLEGPKYVILAPRYRSARGSYAPREKCEKVLLLFGGSDQANLTCRAARCLMENQPGASITACVGPLFPYNEELDQIYSEYGRYGASMRIVKNSPDVCELMMASDVVVTSPGNSLFEAMCLGVPAVAFFQTENQAAMFRGFPMTHEQEEVMWVHECIARIRNDYFGYRRLVDSLQIGAGYEEILNSIRSRPEPRVITWKEASR